jgi:hypothetical protein
MPFCTCRCSPGSDRILKAMNRSHTRDSYLAPARPVRAVRPDIALSGDFIVGFPRRDRRRFRGDAAPLVARSAMPSAFSFKYSPRPGTPAADMDGQIADRRDGRAAPALAGRAQSPISWPSIRPRSASAAPCWSSRPGRHRQDLSRGGACPPAHHRLGRPHHPVAPGGRGRRAARLPARRHEGEGRSLSPPALRRALRHDARRAGRARAHHESGEIEIAPLAFMRGRTLANAFVILDEAQNTTPMQMKMFLTRLGEGSTPHGHHRRRKASPLPIMPPT